MKIRNTRRRTGDRGRPTLVACCWLALTATAAVCVTPSRVEAAPMVFAIEAGAATQTLREFARQANLQTLFDYELVKGLRTQAVAGNLEPEAALSRMLAGTQLTFERTDNSTFAIRKASSREAKTSRKTGAAGDSDDDLTIDEVVVQGTLEMLSFGKENQTLRNIPQSVSIVTRERLDEQNITALDQALNRVVGVYAHDQGGGGGAANVFSRGQYMGAQYDGVPGSLTLNMGNSQFDLSVYERIEVLRGPAGLLQGSGESGGAVNLVRKRPQRQLAGNASVGIGSWNNLHGDADLTGALNDSGTLRARGVLVAEDRDYFYDNADKQSRTGYGIVEFDLTEATTVGVSLSMQRTDLKPSLGQPLYRSSSGRYSFLGVPRSTNLNVDWARSRRDLDEGVVDLTHRFGNDWKLKLNVHQRNHEVELHDGYPLGPVDPATNRSLFLLASSLVESESAGGDVNLSGPIELFGRRHELLLGFNVDRYDADISPGSAVLFNRDLFNPGIDVSQDPGMPNNLASKLDQAGLYGMARIRVLDPLTLIIGGRVGDHTLEARDYAPKQTPAPWRETASAHREFTPYGGLVWDFSRELSLYGSYTEIFSPQSEFDFNGNTLDPRIGYQVEAGLKGEHFGGRLNTSLAVFRLRDSNRASLDPEPTHVGCGGGTCYVAAGLIETEGWELEIVGRPLPGWDLTAGYTDYEQVDKKTGREFSAWQPKRLLKFWSSYRFDGSLLGGALQGWNVGVGMYAQNRVFLTSGAATILEQGGYAVTDVQVGYRFNEQLQATVTVSNVTDRTYYSSVYSASYVNMYGAPRSAMFVVRAKF